MFFLRRRGELIERLLAEYLRAIILFGDPFFLTKLAICFWNRGIGLFGTHTNIICQ